MNKTSIILSILAGAGSAVAANYILNKNMEKKAKEFVDQSVSDLINESVESRVNDLISSSKINEMTRDTANNYISNYGKSIALRAMQNAAEEAVRKEAETKSSQVIDKVIGDYNFEKKISDEIASQSRDYISNNIGRIIKKETQEALKYRLDDVTDTVKTVKCLKAFID